MRKFLTLFTVLLFTTTIFGQKKYETYNNVRFGYSIAYPSDLLAPQKLEDVSNSGKMFLSENKNVEMRVWGEYNALERDLKEEYEADLKDYGGNVSYKVLLKDGFVFSGTKDDKIFYQKTIRRYVEDIDIFYTFAIEYDKSESKKFASIVERIAKSFKFDPKAGV